MELISLLCHFDENLHDFIRIGNMRSKPLDRRNRKSKPEDIKLFAIQIFLFFGMKVEKHIILQTLKDDPYNFLSRIGCRHGKKNTNAINNYKRNFQMKIERKWDEMVNFIDKLEKIRLSWKLDPLSIRTQAADKLFYINSKKKTFRSAICAIKSGQIYRIEGDSGKEILKCVVKGEGIREAKFLKKIRHQNIMKLLDLESKFGLDFIIFNDCGVSIFSKMNEIRNLGLDLIQKLVLDFYDAFAYLHNMRIIHGDIKPENLTINDKQELIVIDFDAAFYEGQADSQIFTPDFCAPEYWTSNLRRRTTKYDVWAGAIVFYEILYGLLPWASCENWKSISHLICSTELSFTTSDPEFDTIMNCAIKNNCSQRENAEEIFTSLYSKMQ
uniref:Protein kinase domain-containing protein n=1 Tax=Tetranychus urticae TaxID=32264 RepID=T1KP90_TETUR